MNNAKKLHPQTLAIRGSKTQTQFKEHHQALFLTSSFMFDSAEEMRRCVCQTPSGLHLFAHQQPHGRRRSNSALPSLEGAEAGMATATGMSAIQDCLAYLFERGLTI